MLKFFDLLPGLGRARNAPKGAPSEVPGGPSFTEDFSPFAPWFVAFGYVALVRAFCDFQRAYEFDPDEGNNVIKALLLDRGFRFGGDIWSDQPPLYSYLLWATFRIFGWQVEYGRGLTLVFAAALLAAVYDMTRREFGHFAAASATGLLVCSAAFVELSVAVMLGLPAISLGTLAVWAAVRFREATRLRWLAASAAFMGAALATKLFVLLILPAIAGSLFVWQSRRRTLKSGVLYAGSYGVLTLLVATVLLSPVLFSGDPATLYRAHLAASGAAEPLKGMAGTEMIPRFLNDDKALFVLAALGAVQALLVRRATSTLAALWLALGLVLVYRHHPVWTHHTVLLTVPAAILAGSAIAGLFEGARNALTLRRGRLTVDSRLLIARAAVPLLVILVVVLTSPRRFERMRKPPPWTARERDAAAEAVLRKYAPETKFLVTARQMYAFRTLLTIPPELAVTSTKRFLSKLLDANAIIQEIKRRAPEQVLLTARWPGSVRARIREHLRANYVRVHHDPRNQNVEIYVLRSLAVAHGDAPLEVEPPAVPEETSPEDDRVEPLDGLEAPP